MSMLIQPFSELGAPVKGQRVAGMLHCIEQAVHPRRGNRQAPTGRGGIQAQVKLTLPGRQSLPLDGLQQFQPRVIMGRADVLDMPRSPAGRVDDLNGRRSRRRLHRPGPGNSTTPDYCSAQIQPS
jgi:hypothetical protein